MYMGDVNMAGSQVPIRERPHDRTCPQHPSQRNAKDNGQQWAVTNEYDTLKEIIVGRAEYSHFPSEPHSIMCNLVPRYNLDKFQPHNPFPDFVTEKAQVELDNLAKFLEGRGVKVHRPQLVDWGAVGGYTGSMVRDGLLVVGNTIMESCFSWACRRHEIELAYGPLLEQFEKEGFRIVRALTPPHPDTIFDIEPGAPWVINNSRVAFDAADFIRCGTTVVGQLSNTTNEKGIEWVRSHMPDGFNLIIIKADNPKEFHIDATFMPLGPGTAVYSPKTVKEEELRRHSPLDVWRLLPVPYEPTWVKYPPPYMCSPLLNMNVLMVDEHTVICEKDDVQMHDFFRKLGIEPVTMPFKHVWSLGGSFHCATADIRRETSKSNCTCPSSSNLR